MKRKRQGGGERAVEEKGERDRKGEGYEGRGRNEMKREGEEREKEREEEGGRKGGRGREEGREGGREARKYLVGY